MQQVLHVKSIEIKPQKSKEEFQKKYKKLVGAALLSYNYSDRKVFTITPESGEPDDWEPTVDSDRFKHAAPAKSSDVQSTKEVLTEFAGNTVEAIVLPPCFYAKSKFTDFPVGTRIVFLSSATIDTTPSTSQWGRNFGTPSSKIVLDFGTVTKVFEDKIKMELDDIPGQIETITNPALIANRIDIIPFLE